MVAAFKIKQQAKLVLNLFMMMMLSSATLTKILATAMKVIFLDELIKYDPEHDFDIEMNGEQAASTDISNSEQQ